MLKKAKAGMAADERRSTPIKKRWVTRVHRRLSAAVDCVSGFLHYRANPNLAKLFRLLAVAACALPAAAPPSEQFREPYRLQFHFSPPENWTNDPNGLVYYKGEYHLFFQYNPFGTQWGHMSWGHAVSADLVHWKPLPVAIPEENGIMIFSGSAVVDAHNSSGLCKSDDPKDPSCLIAIYAGHTDTLQTQNIAFSNDRGRTFTKYSGNPVIDLHLKDFRDPKVLWHEPSKQWIMAAAVSAEKKIRFFASTDLIHWRQLSDFGPEGATGGVWECPDLFELPVEGAKETRWVLVVNINPGGIAGGSGGQYFIGRFDGTKFGNDNPPDRSLWLDYGKDYYAAISFFGAPQRDTRRVMLGWYSNWLYARDTPESTWRGAMAMPRSLVLRNTPEGMRLFQLPVRELETLRTQIYAQRNLNIEPFNQRMTRDRFQGNAIEIEAEFTPADAKDFGVSVLRSTAGDQESAVGHQETVIGIDTAARQVYIDRTHSGNVSFNSAFPSRDAGTIHIGDTVKLHVWVDWSGVEVFVNDGETTLADRVFPAASSKGVQFFSHGGNARIKTLHIWRMGSAWNEHARP
jgi:fructan beta-fructosidase